MTRDVSPWKEKIPCSLRYVGTTNSGLALIVTEGVKDSEGKDIVHFLPISQIEYDEDELEEGKVIEIAIPRWLIKKQGLSV